MAENKRVRITPEMMMMRNKDSMPHISSIEQGLECLTEVYTNPLYNEPPPSDIYTLSLPKQAEYIKIKIRQLASSPNKHPHDNMTWVKAVDLINKL